jgi:hypothetical protein
MRLCEFDSANLSFSDPTGRLSKSLADFTGIGFAEPLESEPQRGRSLALRGMHSIHLSRADAAQMALNPYASRSRC